MTTLEEASPSLKKVKHHRLKTKKFALMPWNLIIAAFYTKNLQETYAYLHNYFYVLKPSDLHVLIVAYMII